MKLYKDSNNQIYNYPEDGSQDHLIDDKIEISQQQANELVIENLKAKGIPITPSYIIDRSKAYPSQADFLDAWVKNDTVALEQYRQKCLAVKAAYPKPQN